ncbi:hypothetical protein LEP1GSC202_1825 [Leptospira yanagawae serovar Saopaulo str. Sao Paulo = ATCC 700523]|uniref:Uncharacterized protein n=1 Tax=Leptospira yanagawae serovar Saopaulo str. Sao Paulo = ATCC 700523 TaxID=1249483 RepID=A0A5E8HDX4_9LEPT|nr:hypothetical protein [Leptospira yanagawae]EOQ89661.1 hypothetical protein LEP1GSC202_1825 [Leptospira yanagawae serovar Saopaulo str. Sao Paulo = ATCC 700523]
MRKPSISESLFAFYTLCIMNRINFESLETLSRQKIVRFLCTLLLVGGMASLGGGCITPDYGNDSYYVRHPSQNGHNYRQYPYPYHGYSGRYGVPYYGGNQYQMPRSGGGGHNPFHIPGGRYNNLGSPGKWRL